MTYQFRWSTRSIKNPHGPAHTRATQYTLICNGCNESILRGTPSNGPGQRYFVHMAIHDARYHLQHCAVNPIAARLQQ